MILIIIDVKKFYIKKLNYYFNILKFKKWYLKSIEINVWKKVLHNLYSNIKIIINNQILI